MNWFRQKQRRWAINQAKVSKLSQVWGAAVEGAEAFRLGQSPVRCPYILGHHKWRAWMAGWQLRFDKHQERKND